MPPTNPIANILGSLFSPWKPCCNLCPASTFAPVDYDAHAASPHPALPILLEEWMHRQAERLYRADSSRRKSTGRVIPKPGEEATTTRMDAVSIDEEQSEKLRRSTCGCTLCPRPAGTGKDGFSPPFGDPVSQKTRWWHEHGSRGRRNPQNKRSYDDAGAGALGVAKSGGGASAAKASSSSAKARI